MPPKKKDKGKGIALSDDSKSLSGQNPLQVQPEKFFLGSSTLGSSTQKPLGPSALKPKIEPSAHSIQSPSDYAIPIETLLALQSNQKLAKLPTKTWADIAEEEDLNKNLALTISNRSKSSSKAGISSPTLSQTNTNSQKSSYVQKASKPMDLFQTENSFYPINPQTLASKVFPPNFHFVPPLKTKTQLFYEFILVDTKSASIKHFPDNSEKGAHAYSTIQILKVISPAEWGNDLNKITKFSQPFDPIGFNYWDYRSAWFNTFWYQNKKFSHSWLILFKNGVHYQFSQWFNSWWNYFGPIQEIFPQNVTIGFEYFSKKINLSDDPHPADLHFFSKFGLAWVFKWQYKYGESRFPNNSPMLQRLPSVKWWPKFEGSERVSPGLIRKWFAKNPKFLLAEDKETCIFLNQKSKIQSCLASSTNKKDLAQQLNNILMLLQTEEVAGPPKSPASKSNTSSDDSSLSGSLQGNEDDCFGINLSDDE